MYLAKGEVIVIIFIKAEKGPVSIGGWLTI